MSFRILVMGLPGSGKTTFSKILTRMLEGHFPDVGYFNAEEVRETFDDWDFSELGRVRQSSRMRDLADHHEVSVCDFVCPTEMTRKKFNADYIIWLNTITESKCADTNKIFKNPKKFDLCLQSWDENAVIMLTAITQIKRRLGENIV